MGLPTIVKVEYEHYPRNFDMYLGVSGILSMDILKNAWKYFSAPYSRNADPIAII